MDAAPEYYNLTELQARNWTKALIKKFLGDADKERQNPRYRSTAPTRLYLAARVIKAEGTAEFVAAMKKRMEAGRRGIEAAHRRREQVLSWVEGLEIRLPEDSIESVTAKAVQSYNDLWTSRGKFEKRAMVDSPPAFIARISVNYLRHECSQYEKNLLAIFGKVGASEAYENLKDRILLKIAEAYPTLDDECFRQQMHARE
jgi:hypothetical protein